MKPKFGQQTKGAIQILEEAICLLRSAPAALLFSYYLGSIPFVLGFLYFWGDMSRSGIAHEHIVETTLGITGLFIWMKFWQSVFAGKIRDHLQVRPEIHWSFSRIFSMTAIQTFVHASGFVILPLAALAVIPFGWCFAFYQNATAIGHKNNLHLIHFCRTAWMQSQIWPRQNHLILCISFLFGICVFFNFSFTIFLFPYLAKSLFGFETVFIMNWSSMLNSTLIITVIGLTYLCLDPVIKTAYVLRCFYGDAIQTGEDLKSELKTLTNSVKIVAGVFLVAAISFSSLNIFAAQPLSYSPQELDHSIEQVLEKREFAWRLPRVAIEEANQKPEGPFAAIFAWLSDVIGRGVRWLKDVFSKLTAWLDSMVPRNKVNENPAASNWISGTRVFLIILLGLFLTVFVFFLFKYWNYRKSRLLEVARPIEEAIPDLNDDNIAADDLPVNRWLEMAAELAGDGSLRLAMRAFYLATISHLAQHNLLTIEIYKSNLEYESELSRRARDKMDLVAAFTDSLGIFEQVWFGMYDVTHSLLGQFEEAQKRIMRIAES